MIDYAKLTKAQLIEVIERQESALISLKRNINAPLAHELDVRQIELEMQNCELREAQLQLGEAHDRYADLHHFSPLGYLTLDKNGCVLKINLAGAAMLGREVAHVISMPFYGYLSPGASDVFYRHLHQVFGPAEKGVTELKIKDSAGKSRDILLESEIGEDTTGAPRTCRTTMTDISQRKHTEKNLDDSEERLRLIGETITEVFWLEDVQTGKLITVSPSYERVWQRSRKELYENPLSFFNTLHPEDRERMLAYKQTQQRLQLPYAHEYRIILPDGAVRWILDRGYPVRDQAVAQEVIQYAGVAQDITGLREAEHRAQELLLQNRLLTRDLFAQKEETCRHLSHELHDEFGQWLTAIQMEAEAILSSAETAPDKILASARAISDSAIEMHGLIRKILSRLRPSLLDTLGLEDSLHEMVTLWRRQHPKIHCNLALDGDLDNLSEAINITVYRAIQEALTNAAQHAQARKVTVLLRRSPDADAASGILLLTVEDDGKGMDPNTARQCLGLLGIRERVIAVGGKFTLRSAPGQGMCIDAQLPLEPISKGEQ